MVVQHVMEHMVVHNAPDPQAAKACGSGREDGVA